MFALPGIAWGCGSGTNEQEARSAFAAVPLTPVANVNFDQPPAGPVGSSWSGSQTGASTATVVKITGHGNTHVSVRAA
jgi:hypothetical protein